MTTDTEFDDAQLPNLGTFSKAAELGNFTAAAKELGLTQAAVSQRIHALERTLNKSLFHRQGGRVVLTEAGQKLYEFAQKILELYQQARREVTGQETPIRGELVLAASSIPSEYILPALLAGFQPKYPHIQIRATVSDSMAAIGQVEAGEVNLGLVGRKVDNPHLDFRFLASDRMVLVMPPKHDLSKRRTLKLKHLSEFPLILRESGSGLRHCFEQSLEKSGHSKSEFQIALELGSNAAIKAAVLRGMGVALLSIFCVEKEIQSGELVAKRVSDLHCDRDMFLVWDTRRVLPAPARLFLIYLETNPLATLDP